MRMVIKVSQKKGSMGALGFSEWRSWTWRNEEDQSQPRFILWCFEKPWEHLLLISVMVCMLKSSTLGRPFPIILHQLLRNSDLIVMRRIWMGIFLPSSIVRASSIVTNLSRVLHGSDFIIFILGRHRSLLRAIDIRHILCKTLPFGSDPSSYFQDAIGQQDSRSF